MGVPGRDVDSAVMDIARGFFAAASLEAETTFSDPSDSFLGICKGPGCCRLVLDIADFISCLTAEDTCSAFRGEGGTLLAFGSDATT